MKRTKAQIKRDISATARGANKLVSAAGPNSYDDFALVAQELERLAKRIKSEANLRRYGKSRIPGAIKKGGAQ